MPLIHRPCPHCLNLVPVPPTARGTEFLCPRCLTFFPVPLPPPPAEPAGGRRWLFFAIGFGGVLGLSFMTICVWFVARHVSPSAGGVKQPLTHEQLAGLIDGATPERVRALLGPPDDVQHYWTAWTEVREFGGRGPRAAEAHFWVYKDLVIDPQTGRRRTPYLWIKGGRFGAVTYP
jgi:hypothetical protein